MTAPHDGARGDARKRHDAPTCLVCGNSVPVGASALAAAKAEGRREALQEVEIRLLLRDVWSDHSRHFIVTAIRQIAERPLDGAA